MENKETKPVSECQTLGEVLASLNAMCKELNEIPSVKATMTINQTEDSGGG